MTEDKMVRWHHGLNGHKFEQVLGDGEGQKNLVCCRQRVRHSLVTAQQQILAFLVAQRVKRQPAMRETQVRSLGREDPLEQEMATHSITLAWKI